MTSGDKLTRPNRRGAAFTFNPHLHVFAADGAFLPDERFVALPPVPGTLLAEGFRRAVLKFLVKNGALFEALRSRMLAWRHCGFSAQNAVRAPHDEETNAVSSPQTRRAVSTTSLNFRSWSAGVTAFPITELEKPHCGLSAKRSRGTKRLASRMRLTSSSIGSR